MSQGTRLFVDIGIQLACPYTYFVTILPWVSTDFLSKNPYKLDNSTQNIGYRSQSNALLSNVRVIGAACHPCQVTKVRYHLG